MEKTKKQSIVTGYQKHKPEDILVILANHADCIRLLQVITAASLFLNFLMFAAVCFAK